MTQWREHSDTEGEQLCAGHRLTEGMAEVTSCDGAVVQQQSQVSRDHELAFQLHMTDEAF